MGCSGILLSHCAPCRIILDIDAVDPRSPAFSVVPALQGGGIELP
jgi:hypothetical protein